MEGLQMNSAAVNLGAGGFVSYFEDGGATVVLGGEKLPPPVQEEEFDERGPAGVGGREDGHAQHHVHLERPRHRDQGFRTASTKSNHALRPVRQYQHRAAISVRQRERQGHQA